MAHLLSETLDVNIDMKMQSNSGEWVISPEQKLKFFEEYYMQLYASDNPSVDMFEEFVSILDLPNISLEQPKSLSSPISLNEIIIGIDILTTGKAPGLDGFTLEFYKMFKFSLPPKLYKLFVLALDYMKIPSSWREASVVLIPKEEKDLCVQQCYRPISLLNVDYQSLTSLIAFRLIKIS